MSHILNQMAWCHSKMCPDCVIRKETTKLGEVFNDVVICEDHAPMFNDPNYDPSPWCGGCGSMTKAGCHCGPIARND